MAIGKKSFILYTDQYSVIKQLPDDVAGKLLKTIYAYVNDENPQVDDLLLKIAFEPIKQQMKRDLKQWEETTESRSVTGRLGGIKSGEIRRKQKEANEANALKSKQKEANEANALKSKQKEANEAVNVTVNDNVTVNEIKKESDKSLTLQERKDFFMNSLIEFVEEYSKETVRAFFDHWSESNENGKKMRFEMEKVFDRKKRLDTWKRNEKNFNRGGVDKKTQDYKNMQEITKKSSEELKEYFKDK